MTAQRALRDKRTDALRVSTDLRASPVALGPEPLCIELRFCRVGGCLRELADRW
jgi:hypothetical protein